MLTFFSRVVPAAVVTATAAVFIATSSGPPLAPTCGKITAKWQGAWIFMPDCPTTPAPPPANPAPPESPNPAPDAPPP